MELTPLLAKVDELAHEIKKVRPLKPEVELRIFNKFRLDWNYNSNAIEGNKLTLGETKAFLMEGLTADGKPLKDHLDIRGHDEVITFLKGFVNRKEILTETDIRGLHKILLHEPYEVQATTLDGRITSKWVKLGEYKTEPNYVRTATGETKQFVSPQDTPAEMQRLMVWFNKAVSEKSAHPIILASVFHNRFTQIHPFDDGNGRMARILLNLILMQNELLPVVIKMSERDRYIYALVKADVGENESVLALVAEAEIHSQELFLKGASGSDISDFDDVDKRVALLKQELQHKEKPVELSVEIQKHFVSNCIKPIIDRLINKMNQFNDLFANNQLTFSGMYGYTLSPHTGGRAWSNNSHVPLEMQFLELLDLIDTENKFSFVRVIFQWEGFQRAGLNTFNFHFQVEFSFDKYNYLIKITTERGRAIFETRNVYQILPNEDQILLLLKSAAESFYAHIEEKIKAK